MVQAKDHGCLSGGHRDILEVGQVGCACSGSSGEGKGKIKCAS